jgi:hypothetical protein
MLPVGTGTYCVFPSQIQRLFAHTRLTLFFTITSAERVTLRGRSVCGYHGFHDWQRVPGANETLGFFRAPRYARHHEETPRARYVFPHSPHSAD